MCTEGLCLPSLLVATCGSAAWPSRRARLAARPPTGQAGGGTHVSRWNTRPRPAVWQSNQLARYFDHLNSSSARAPTCWPISRLSYELHRRSVGAGRHLTLLSSPRPLLLAALKIRCFPRARLTRRSRTRDHSYASHPHPHPFDRSAGLIGRALATDPCASTDRFSPAARSKG